MTNRRAVAITLTMLAFAPLLYWDGSFAFYDNSEQSNPLRAAVALGPFVMAALGTAVNFLERRSGK